MKRKEEYKAYRLTQAWKEKRDAVLRRAGGMCEGCGKKRATEVHHLTYEHIFKEFLWELQAVCRECHERWHEINE